MELVQLISQYSLHFTGLMRCQHCHELGQYSVAYGSTTVPELHCKACDKDEAGNVTTS